MQNCEVCGTLSTQRRCATHRSDSERVHWELHLSQDNRDDELRRRSELKAALDEEQVDVMTWWPTPLD